MVSVLFNFSLNFIRSANFFNFFLTERIHTTKFNHIQIDNHLHGQCSSMTKMQRAKISDVARASKFSLIFWSFFYSFLMFYWPEVSAVLTGRGRGANAPPGSSDVGPLSKMPPLIRLPLLPKQFNKLGTFSLYKFVFATADVSSCKALRKDFFKWYLHCQDC